MTCVVTEAEPWYALQVRPRREKQVCDSLGRKKYRVFLPLYQELEPMVGPSQNGSAAVIPRICVLPAGCESPNRQPWGGPAIIDEPHILAGVEGILMDTRWRQALVVSIDLLRRSVAVEIEQLSVESVDIPFRSAVGEPGQPFLNSLC
jgi:hypothetical protein